MAMKSTLKPLLSAFRPMRGTITWLWLRFGILIFSSLPALIAGLAGVSGGIAKRPYYTEVEGKLPLAHLVRLFKDLPGGFLPAAAISVLFVILADQLFTGGALAFFDPARSASERGKVFTAIFRDGLSHLWAFLRVVGVSLIFWAIGIGLIRVIFKKLDAMAYHSGWSGETAFLQMPLLSTLLSLVWIASVGAWTFWCRVITVADRRRRVRRTGLLVFRVFWRHPLRSWGIFTGLTLVTTLVSAAILIAWRHAEPRAATGVIQWLLLWLLALIAQSFVWLWLVRAARLLYASDGLADIRNIPDEPFRLFSKLLWWRKKAPSY